MKIRSYKLLFRIFSYLSDKTNGAPLFVKYKLLLGTIIIGLTSMTSMTGCKSRWVVMCYVPPAQPPVEDITCYKPAIGTTPSEMVEVRGKIIEETDEPLIGTVIAVKGKPQQGVVTDLDGIFSLKVSPTDTLVISYIGYKTVEESPEQLNGKTIKMVPDEDAIEPIITIRQPVTCYMVTRISLTEQINTIKGKVMDETGQTMPGTTIIVKKRPTNGTVTDEEGNFELRNVQPNDVLVFSFLGMDTREIRVSEIDDKPIVLKEDNVVLCYEATIVSYNPPPVTKLSYSEIQVPPVSPVGDRDKFQQWMEESIVYNEQMLSKKTEGQLILSFIINEKGEITEAKVLSKLSPEADAEALRILRSSDKWTAGEHNGKKIKTVVTVPVRFKLPQ
ncbi:MAG: TonB family protein [Dysgonomonas sp.]|nr:TonB family protein [Dysgonomonas sp.]